MLISKPGGGTLLTNQSVGEWEQNKKPVSTEISRSHHSTTDPDIDWKQKVVSVGHKQIHPHIYVLLRSPLGETGNMLPQNKKGVGGVGSLGVRMW